MTARSHSRFAKGLSFCAPWALAAWLGWAPEALACSAPVTGWQLEAATQQVPANGAVLALLSCGEECDVVPEWAELELRDAKSGDVVVGSVTFSGGNELSRWATFRPDSPFEVGRSYTLHLGALISPEVVEASAAYTPQASALVVSERFFVAEVEVGPWACCTLGPIDSCNQFPCLSSQLLSEGVVSLSWSDPLSSEPWFLSRIVRPGAAAAPPWSWSYGRDQVRVQAGATEVCYTLELRSLVDDSVHRFDERCVAVPETAALGLHEPTSAVMRQFLGNCHGPPAGSEQAWCEARSDSCSSQQADGGCGAVEQCASGGAGGAGGGAGPAGAGSAGEGDSGGSAGAGDTGGSVALSGAGGRAATGGGGPVSSGGSNGEPTLNAGSPAVSAGAVAAKGGGGCSVPGRPRSSDLGLLGLAALLGVQLLRRRSQS